MAKTNTSKVTATPAAPGADSKPPAADKTKTVKVKALSVASGREGFRRGGRAWAKGETVVKLSELSKEQIAQIKGEKLLTVAEVEIDEEVAA